MGQLDKAMNFTFLRWDCDHQTSTEGLRTEKGKLICEVCKREVRQWVEPDLASINMNDFPTLTKLSPKGANELQQFASKVREWELTRLLNFASGKNATHAALRELIKEYELDKRRPIV